MTDPPTTTATPDAACASIASCTEVLRTSTDRDALREAGVWLASRGEPPAVRALGEHLGDAGFLARLDRVDVPGEKTYNLSRIFAALRQTPIPEVAVLCQTLARDPELVADPDRVVFVLQAAAAVDPMTDETVALFVETNAIDYAPINGVLLGRNASPKALALLQTMLLDPATDVEDRTDTVHTALLPVRTDEDVLEMSARLLDHKLPVALEIALIETLLDDPRVEWFGKVGTRPQPRPWTEASAEALRLALALADKIRRRRRLPKDLRSRVAHTATSIRAALEAK